SGALRRSISTDVTSGPLEAVGVISTGEPYARIQEFGGRISARNGANLTIPLAAALDADGLARFSAREVIATPGVGGFASSFVRKNILFGARPGLPPTPLFKLQPSVELPARSFFGAALSESRSEILAAFSSAVSGAIADSNVAA